MIGIERRFSDDTRLIDLTVGDLKDLIASLMPHPEPIKEKRYVYGYKGIAALFNCSLRAAQSLKQGGKIDKAITQDGRKIIVDANLALELLKYNKR